MITGFTALLFNLRKEEIKSGLCTVAVQLQLQSRLVQWMYDVINDDESDFLGSSVFFIPLIHCILLDAMLLTTFHFQYIENLVLK